MNGWMDMKKKFSDLSRENQEKFVESLMEIKSESERCVIEIVKGTDIEINYTINLIKKQIIRLVNIQTSS